MSNGRVRTGVFSIDVDSCEGEVVLVLHGELDLWTQPQLLNALADVEDASRRIVLDLADLTFIDAGNVGLIHRARMLAGLRGTELLVRSHNPRLTRIRELTGLDPDALSRAEPAPIVLPLPSFAYEHAAR